jgi:hypothetical protein
VHLEGELAVQGKVGVVTVTHQGLELLELLILEEVEVAAGLIQLAVQEAQA